MDWLLVGTGGIIGALLRFQLSKWMNEKWVMTFPYPTLLINLTGALLLGWLTRSMASYFPAWKDAPMLFLGTGLCGAYTTFSTFSYETLTMMRENRFRSAFIYIVSSCVFGLVLSAIGLFGWPPLK